MLSHVLLQPGREIQQLVGCVVERLQGGAELGARAAARAEGEGQAGGVFAEVNGVAPGRSGPVVLVGDENGLLAVQPLLVVIVILVAKVILVTLVVSIVASEIVTRKIVAVEQSLRDIGGKADGLLETLPVRDVVNLPMATSDGSYRGVGEVGARIRIAEKSKRNDSMSKVTLAGKVDVVVEQVRREERGEPDGVAGIVDAGRGLEL